MSQLNPNAPEFVPRGSLSPRSQLNPNAREFVPSYVVDELKRENGELRSKLPKRMLKVTYDVHYEEHSGYCSDAHGRTSRNETEREILPVPKELSEEEFNAEGKIVDLSVLDGVIEYTKNWAHGNGYCGCKCWRRIKTAKRILV